MIDVFRPSLGEAELSAVAEVFGDNWLGHGPRTRAFEAEFAAATGTDPEATLFLNSGTAGLFLAAELLGLGPGDEVVMPSLSFVAAADAVASRGASPVFCEVDARTMNPTPAHVARAVTPRTRAVVVQHYGGSPGDIAAMADWCRERGLTLVEDAANAAGSAVEGVACGAFGDLAVWSFGPSSTLVTGYGGMLRVPAELAPRARRLAFQGLAHDNGFAAARVSRSWWDLDVRDLGHRAIGNDLTAALGRVQLGRLPEFTARRRRTAALYDALLADVPGVRTPPPLPEGHTSAYSFYWIQLDAAHRDRVAADLRAAGIATARRYPPLHLAPTHATGAALPVAEAAHRSTLLLPLHQRLTDDEVRFTVSTLRTALGAPLGERV